VKVGGEAMGPVYDQLVMKPGELPIEAELAKMSLILETKGQDYTDVGFDASTGMGGVRVQRVRGATGLAGGDVISQINDTSFVGLTGGDLQAAYRKVTDAAKPGDKLSVKYKRGETEGSADVTVTKATRDVYSVSSQPGVSRLVLQLRDGWYRAGKKPMPYTG